MSSTSDCKINNNMLTQHNPLKKSYTPSPEETKIIDQASKIISLTEYTKNGVKFKGEGNQQDFYARISTKSNKTLVYSLKPIKKIGSGEYKTVMSIKKITNGKEKALLKLNSGVNSVNDFNKELEINNKFNEFRKKGVMGLPFPIHLVGKNLYLQKKASGDAVDYMHGQIGDRTIKRSMKYISQLFRGFIKMCEIGIPYDIKPANILIYPKGIATFTDFGMFDEYKSKNNQKFQTKGTLFWISAKDAIKIETKKVNREGMKKFCLFTFIATAGAILIGDHPCTILQVNKKHVSSEHPSQEALRFFETLQNEYGTQVTSSLLTLFNRTIYSSIERRSTPQEAFEQWNVVIEKMVEWKNRKNSREWLKDFIV